MYTLQIYNKKIDFIKKFGGKHPVIPGLDERWRSRGSHWLILSATFGCKLRGKYSNRLWLNPIFAATHLWSASTNCRGARRPAGNTLKRISLFPVPHWSIICTKVGWRYYGNAWENDHRHSSVIMGHAKRDCSKIVLNLWCPYSTSRQVASHLNCPLWSFRYHTLIVWCICSYGLFPPMFLIFTVFFFWEGEIFKNTPLDWVVQIGI